MTNLDALKILHNMQVNLLKCKQSLDILESEEPQNMAISADVAAILKAVDDATTAIANRIAALVAKSAGLSQEEKDAFAAEVSKLTDLGKSDIVVP